MSGDAEIVRIVLINKSNYYKCLSVERTATTDEINRAYKKMAVKLHPDKNKTPRAEEAFKIVCNAKETLTDDNLRRAYDRGGEEGARRAQQPGAHARAPRQHREPEDIFEAFFGPQFQRQRRRAPDGQGPHVEFQEMNINGMALLPFAIFILLIMVLSSLPSVLDGSGMNSQWSHNQNRRRSLFKLYEDPQNGFTVQRVTTLTTNEFPDLTVTYYVQNGYEHKLAVYQVQPRSVEMEVLRAKKQYWENRCYSELLKRKNRQGRTDKDEPGACREQKAFQRVSST